MDEQKHLRAETLGLLCPRPCPTRAGSTGLRAELGGFPFRFGKNVPASFVRGPWGVVSPRPDP